MMKKAFPALAAALLLASGLTLRAQVATVSSDDTRLAGLKRLTLPAGYASRPLPDKKDNTKLIYFSGIYSQWVWNCNQAASIWTMFTYEMNYLRGLNSSDTANQYSPMAVYNLLNYGNPVQGVSYFDSWNLVKANGIPGNNDFSAGHQNAQVWMSGYDKYYRGMKNRIDEVFAIDVGNPEGLITLKHWINDHLAGSQVGGLANFQIGSGDMVIPQIPMGQNLEEEGKYIVIKYGPYVGHAMTFAGWNDSVRFDVNGDGRFTNHLDINKDGVVDMKDWEIGAMLVVNSWSLGWGNQGKVWVMYRLLAEKVEQGGIWNNAAMVVVPRKTYNPQLTVKAKVRYSHRNKIRIQAGISSDPNASRPDRVLDFPCFSFQGDTLPMKGYYGPNADQLELGLDITPLLNEVGETGQARIFLEVIQKSADSKGVGAVESFSVMDYTNGSRESAWTGGSQPILKNSVTRLSVQVSPRINRPVILNGELPDALVGQPYRVQLEADGTAGPFHFENPAATFLETPETQMIGFTGGTDVFEGLSQPDRVMDLPFRFPLYGTEYTQVTVMKDGGLVMGQSLVKYPYVIDHRLRFRQNRGVFPFLGILWYPDPEHKVTFQADNAEAIVRWKASTDPEGLNPVEFAVKIKPDGSVRMYYGEMMTTPDIDWISGISSGDHLQYTLMKHNPVGISRNTAFLLSLMPWPQWLLLGSNGDLKGTPDKNGLYVLPFKVTDGSGLSSVKELTLKVTGNSGIGEVPEQSGITVYPNPSEGDCRLTGHASVPGTFVFSVWDLTGRLLFTKMFEVKEGAVSESVPELSDLTQGIYLYRTNGVIEASGKIIRSARRY